jgi:hypothetical protein
MNTDRVMAASEASTGDDDSFDRRWMTAQPPDGVKAATLGASPDAL